MPRRYSTRSPAKLKADSSFPGASRSSWESGSKKPDRGSRPGSSQPIRADWQGVRSPRHFNSTSIRCFCGGFVFTFLLCGAGGVPPQVEEVVFVVVDVVVGV